MGTRCHMLGMYVVLENYQGMLCDFPVCYMGEPGFEVLQQMPVVWDETKVLDAKPNQYITIARKHQNDWYVGTINNLTEKEIKIDLDFLPKGKFDAIVYSDHFEIPFNPNHLHKDNRLVDNTTKINLHVAAGGGSVIIIHLKKTPS